MALREVRMEKKEKNVKLTPNSKFRAMPKLGFFFV
jgi:hypothetical protein